MTLEEDIDVILLNFAEAGFQVELDKEWMRYAYRADRREEYQNETYYEHHTPLEVTPCIADPKSTTRIVQAIDNNALARLKSFEDFVRHHCLDLWTTLTLVLKNGATRRFESYLAILRDMLEKELLRRSKRAFTPQRSKPRLRWRKPSTKGKETNS